MVAGGRQSAAAVSWHHKQQIAQQASYEGLPGKIVRARALERRGYVLGDNMRAALKTRKFHHGGIDSSRNKFLRSASLRFDIHPQNMDVHKNRCTVDAVVETIEPQARNFAELTTTLIAAYVSNNHIQPSEIGALIASTHAALVGLGKSGTLEAPPVEKLTPAQIRKSVTPDALISFIDGKPYKTLKRHLGKSGMTMEEYRQRFGLPRDYPSTAASYSEQRSALARSFGLGQHRGKAAPKAAEPAEVVSDKPKRAGRPRKAKDAAEA